MMHENIGFKVDRNLQKAIADNDLEGIKKILAPDENADDVSLESLLVKTIQLGRIYYPSEEVISEFRKLDHKQREEGEKKLNAYLHESTDIILNLIDYLVSKGADVNAQINSDELICPKNLIGNLGIDPREVYKLKSSLSIPLTIGKYNIVTITNLDRKSQQIRRNTSNPGLKARVEAENSEKIASRFLARHLREHNSNMQVRVTELLIAKGANRDRTCAIINEERRADSLKSTEDHIHTVQQEELRLNFLEFINECAEGYTHKGQKRDFLILYNITHKDLAQNLEGLRLAEESKKTFEPGIPSALGQLIEKKKVELAGLAPEARDAGQVLERGLTPPSPQQSPKKSGWFTER